MPRANLRRTSNSFVTLERTDSYYTSSGLGKVPPKVIV